MGDPVNLVTFGLAEEGTFVGDLFRGDPGASARRQKRKADEANRQIVASQNRIEQDIKDRQEKEKQSEIDAAVRNRRRAVRQAGRTDFRRGTILTSPIGAQGQPQTANKTILGQ